MATNTSGIPGFNSEINMAERSEVPVAMDDATGRSTTPTPGDVSVHESFDMGGASETSLDFSVSPTKDEATASIFPPARRQRRGAAPAGTSTALVVSSVGKRPSSAGPPRTGRAKGSASASPWPDSTSAVHGRVKVADDQWTILQIVAQLDIDREQIAMLKEAVESLHTSRVQDSADHLALAKRLDQRDFQYTLENVDLKKKVQDVYDLLKGDVSQSGLVQIRVDAGQTPPQLQTDAESAAHAGDLRVRLRAPGVAAHAIPIWDELRTWDPGEG